ncbi:MULTISPECIES: sensor histidine kinase [unclassified Aureimonas]|uniref:sensor histidine kinase n=1 Tax=unclassified Aureimonas TaxID=2615206 RepID=UPI00138F582B|nr:MULTISPECIES: ATP-binding protein [unclassified Aureimonas]
MSIEYMTFAEPAEVPPAAIGGSRTAGWKLAVIDDDQAVHDGTRYALRNYRLNGRGFELLGAHSGSEGFELLRDHPDTAIVLLDVVMETEDAGLRLARRIREELGNEFVRIILRTGQPGQAPEQRIVIDYDINDYKAKTELTAERLFTTLTSSLRSYEQLRRLDDMRSGLETIVGCAVQLGETRCLTSLAEGVLMQLNAVLTIEAGGMLVLRETLDGAHAVLARTGSFVSPEPGAVDLHALFAEAALAGHSLAGEGHKRLYVRTGGGSELLVILDPPAALTPTQISLAGVFAARLGVAFDNVRLHESLARANADLERRVEARTAELGAANARLEAQGAQLKRVNAFKNEILGTIAHDLKNPLAVILGRTEMMTTLAAKLGEPVLSSLDPQIGHVRAAALRMNRIVDVSVADAMADAFDISVARRSVDLGAIVRSVAELNEGLAEAKGQVLEIEAETGLHISGDPDRLMEAVDNLVSNAVKYTPAGGRIRVSARLVGGEAEAAVADSGPGLKPEDVSRLFGRFQRLSAQPTGGESSTGLGLSIVRKIVDLHGGRIHIAETGPLGGACFALVFSLLERRLEP